MATLVAMRYTTNLFFKLADHAYVECGPGGRGWGCGGGKTGGTALRSGSGSSRRADEIAQPDGSANLKCYLINGVCHQAANRILLPAGITVRGARGYSVSQALFGTYGRIGSGACKAPFPQYPSVTGDLEDCMPPAGVRAPEAEVLAEQDVAYSLFLREELEMHRGAESLLSKRTIDTTQAVDFSMGLFRHMAAYQLKDELHGSLEKRVLAIRLETEQERMPPDESFANDEMDAQALGESIDSIAESFQDRMANALTTEQYQRLFDLSPDERITLADPEIVSGLR